MLLMVVTADFAVFRPLLQNKPTLVWFPLRGPVPE